MIKVQWLLKADASAGNATLNSITPTLETSAFYVNNTIIINQNIQIKD